ncbi:MAG: glucose-1-phosphate adenylyltransferase [Cytophagales bacterium]|jgi:glucose-1-phosphate adenylyltransferase|nr:glucose-1-phosphate adenylyltransferase [Cytophagales bacterium]MCA6367203.1 glucose-1-phosphate adenylyltransferase [Cytophagales bacterium]MCA6373240.1 glucose-1-phosphate adenylyltransferase [Cytophagales bacterium]MCA6374198.1 glucose-1-phosphate adenylyltransferase [Cytophagales bacterium]MCA6381925.1 glucose-1-phosphate adenylyltransferase [Cytophagales bacterium]
MIKDDVLAIILGGGQGSRLYPLTADRSKPAVPIAGKYRLVDIPLSNCINSSINRMFVLTQFNSASLNRHIKNTYNFSVFSNAFIDLLAAEQTMSNKNWFQGTADAVRQSMHHFLNHDFKYALILSGDQLYQMDFNHLIERHMESGARITIATLPVTAGEGTEFGIMKTDEENMITQFVEKPNAEEILKWNSDVSDYMKSEGRLYLASMGIYVFERELLIELMNDPKTNDFGKEIIPQSIGKHKVLSYQFEGYWTDIGNIRSFFDANLGLTDPIPSFNLFDNKNRIYTHARLLPPSKISGTLITDSVIADGCIIHAGKIERSVIGVRSRLEIGSTVIRTYVMGNDSYQTLKEIAAKPGDILMGVGAGCHIENAILDKNCRIGSNVTIIGGPHLENCETDSYVISGGIVVVKKGATIPPGFVIK